MSLALMIDHPYAEFLISLEHPGRYVGGEYGAKQAPREAEFRIALAFPDSYEIGMSHIGLSILYEIINNLPHISAERVFMPWADLEDALRQREKPLVSLESSRPLNAFDVVGFSLQYELTYTNLLAMLSLSGIPLRAEERPESAPLILVGGPAATHAEPLAPFVDLCLVGDGEEALPALLETLVAAKKAGCSRSEKIARASEHESVFAPFLLSRTTDRLTGQIVIEGDRVPVARLAKVSSLAPHPAGLGPVPTVEAVFDRYSIEVARGCAEGCRFCQAGFLYRPVRERTETEALCSVNRAVSKLGVDEVSLAALSTADHSRITPLISTLGEELTKRYVSLSVPSLRAYGLPSELVEILGRLRATGVTLAPEAGSQRLRDAINKNVTEQDLMDAAARFFEQGFQRIKLYFMLGLPGETDDDLREIIALSARLRALGKKCLRRQPDVTISVSTFVPKPFTPFERETMIGFKEIERRQSLLRDLSRREKMEIRLHSARLSVLEGILSRGDVELAQLIERAFDLGARFDGWEELHRASIWDEVLSDVDVDSLLGPRPDHSRLPWDHVDAGLDPDFLSKERERAKQGETTPPCGRFTGDKEQREHLICHHCGLKCRLSDLPLRTAHVLQRAETNQTGINPAPTRSGTSRGRKRAVKNEEGQQTRVRFFFAKWQRQAFVGHLDTMRHLVRSLRRADLQLVYTEGFHPKPKTESAPPLPLGTIGLREPLDAFLFNPPNEQEMLQRLKLAVPQDLEFTAASILPSTAKKLGKSLREAKYIGICRADRAQLNDKIAELMSTHEHIIPRIHKGLTKHIDIRSFITSLSLLEKSEIDLRVPDLQGRVMLSFSIDLLKKGSARPREILSALLGEEALHAWIVRTGFIFL